MSQIDRNEVLALIDETINTEYISPMARLFLLRYSVQELPPAESDLTEMVAVVRCKDCRHQRFYINDKESFRCDKAHIANMHMDDGDGDFFCAYGERREE